jgi:hypothetical protein
LPIEQNVEGEISAEEILLIDISPPDVSCTY